MEKLTLEQKRYIKYFGVKIIPKSELLDRYIELKALYDNMIREKSEL